MYNNPVFELPPEPYISFHHALVKAKWASMLIGNLDTLITTFLEDNEFTFEIARDTINNNSSLFIDTNIEWPLHVPCLIGDICHNLRASLDFCYMGVCRSVFGDDAAKRTLPIADNLKGLENTVVNHFKEHPAAVTKVVKFLQTEIKSHHDFDAGGNSTLVALNKLSNWQKHNMLIPFIGVAKMPDNFRMFSPSTNSLISGGGGRISNSRGNIFCIAGADAEITYDGEPAFEIRFPTKELGGDNPIIPALVDIHKVTSECIEAFLKAWWSDDFSPHIGK